MSKKKVFVIGLDCATPQIVFENLKSELPNLEKLLDTGFSAKMNSTIPAITVPAWSSMLSGRDPGELGFYGFRNRRDRSYENLIFANSRFVKAKRIWDYLTDAGRKSIVIGVPQTYPPSDLNGYLVSSFLTPDTNSKYTYPESFKQEINEVVDGYMIDVDNFRTDEKQRLLDDIYKMTEKRFKLVNHMLDKHDDWDFFMFVEMGVDRIHHGFWKYHDREHPKFEPGNLFEKSIKDYYIYLDKEIGKILEKLDEDTVVIVVSDHGAKSMIGGICINEWLIKNGYLKVKKYPEQVTRINRVEIDWPNTRAWGFGGYYSRIFLNVEGREPNGVIPAEDYEKVRDELKKAFESMTDEQGKSLGTRVFKPEEIYNKVRNIAPDLLIYFGDLSWRSVGSLGLNKIYTYENDTGPDDANHAQHGIFMMNDLARSDSVKQEEINILDIAPTILNILGIEYPDDLSGKPIKY